MDRGIIKTSLYALLLMSMLGLSGCTLGTAVQPWEKETLARPEMTFEGDKLDKAYTEPDPGTEAWRPNPVERLGQGEG